MSSNKISVIEQDWPDADLERVETCPYCDSPDRTLAFDSVRDWSFHSAPGKWNYWNCSRCRSLFLDPRPTEQSIGRAYGIYYTHVQPGRSLPARLKNRLRNEYISLAVGKSIEPRLGLPRIFRKLVAALDNKIIVPFGLRELAGMPLGRYMDVGCGHGSSVLLVKQIGWDARGIEIDPEAVKAARASKLDVELGTYRALSEYPAAIDFLQCSHVVEHVHRPRELISLLQSSVSENGVIAISCPNSLSPVRSFFGKHWRGIEAPRHLAIPSRQILRDLFTSRGFLVSESLNESAATTEAESFRIQRQGLQMSKDDVRNGRILHARLDHAEPDFIRMICRRRGIDEKNRDVALV